MQLYSLESSYKFGERILAITVPILFVVIERFFIQSPSYKILDAYILTQIVQIILGASIFLTFYKKKIDIWRTKIFKLQILATLITACILYAVSENILMLFTITYISCVPLELQNVFQGRHIKNLYNRFGSITAAILAYIIFGSIELSYATERSTFFLLTIRSSKHKNSEAPWKGSIKLFQVIPIYMTGVLTVIYGRFDQLYLMYFSDKAQLANYLLILRAFDIGILILNSVVMAQINSENYNLSLIRKNIDIVFGILIFIMLTTAAYSASISIDEITIFFLIIFSYYFMSWGVIKALYTHHNIAHIANLKCQLIGVTLAITYLLALTQTYGFAGVPFYAVVALPAVGQIGANLFGPLLITSERRFIFLIFKKERKK